MKEGQRLCYGGLKEPANENANCAGFCMESTGMVFHRVLYKHHSSGS